MKLTSTPKDGSNKYLPIAPNIPINGIQLSLRGNRKLDKDSYVKRVRFEVDVRLLALYNGFRPEILRLTKGSVKVLVKEIPVVIPWLPSPVFRPLPSDPRIGSSVGSGAPQTWAGRAQQQDVESQPLLECSSEHSSDRAMGCTSKEGSYGVSQRLWSCVEPPLKLVLCVLILLLLIIAVIVKTFLAPICIALSNLFAVISDDFTDGPTRTCNQLGKRLLAVLTGDNLASLMNGAKEDD